VFGDVLQVKAAAFEQGGAEGQRHLRVVGDLAGLEAQPAAADDLAQFAVLGLDFRGGEEFDGGAKGVADGKAEVGATGAAMQVVGGRLGCGGGRNAEHGSLSSRRV